MSGTQKPMRSRFKEAEGDTCIVSSNMHRFPIESTLGLVSKVMVLAHIRLHDDYPNLVHNCPDLRIKDNWPEALKPTFIFVSGAYPSVVARSESVIGGIFYPEPLVAKIIVPSLGVSLRGWDLDSPGHFAASVVMTIAHEAVHFQQFAHGILCDDSGPEAEAQARSISDKITGAICLRGLGSFGHDRLMMWRSMQLTRRQNRK